MESNKQTADELPSSTKKAIERDLTGESENSARPSVWAIAGSVAAAAFGVQSSKNLQRDFSQKSFIPYIIGGVVFTILFVIAVATLVSVVLKSSGA